MTRLAAVVLAHADPEHLHRLVGALDPAPVYLHIDARTDASTFETMTAGLPSRVHLLPRIPTWLATWSLVEAELAGLRDALEDASTTHVAIMSGADYPLAPVAAIEAQLPADGLIWNIPLPHPRWDTRLHKDGGRWRVRYRFWRHHGRPLTLAGVPLRWPVARRVPPELTLHACSQWKVYSRRRGEQLLHIVDTRPDLLAFWRHTLVPEEMFVSSILASPELVADPLSTSAYQPWFMVWPSGPHPQLLTLANLDRLTAASQDRDQPKLFARKFSSTASGPLLDAIDTGLLLKSPREDEVRP